jgi:hypothetical protein
MVLFEIPGVRRSAEDSVYSLRIFFSHNLQNLYLNFQSVDFFPKKPCLYGQIPKFCNKVTIYFPNPQIANKFSPIESFLSVKTCFLSANFYGTSAHIPSVSLFCNPRTVAMFHTIPEQGKNWTPKQSIPEQHGLFVLPYF